MVDWQALLIAPSDPCIRGPIETLCSTVSLSLCGSKNEETSCLFVAFVYGWLKK
jgi:hypothetical protein